MSKERNKKKNILNINRLNIQACLTTITYMLYNPSNDVHFSSFFFFVHLSHFPYRSLLNRHIFAILAIKIREMSEKINKPKDNVFLIAARKVLCFLDFLFRKLSIQLFLIKPTALQRWMCVCGSGVSKKKKFLFTLKL